MSIGAPSDRELERRMLSAACELAGGIVDERTWWWVIYRALETYVGPALGMSPAEHLYSLPAFAFEAFVETLEERAAMGARARDLFG